jgi:hypothetical protein
VVDLLEPPEPCYPVLEALISKSASSPMLVWARIRNQFEANKIHRRRVHMNYLPPSQTPDKKLAQTIIDRAAALADQLPSDFSGNRMQRELAASWHPAHRTQRPAHGGTATAADRAFAEQGGRAGRGVRSAARRRRAHAGGHGVVPQGRRHATFR